MVSSRWRPTTVSMVMTTDEVDSLLVGIWVLGSLAVVVTAYISNARNPWKSEVGIVWLVCWMWPFMVIIVPGQFILDEVIYPIWYGRRDKVRDRKKAKQRNKIANQFGEGSVEVWRWDNFRIIPK